MVTARITSKAANPAEATRSSRLCLDAWLRNRYSAIKLRHVLPVQTNKTDLVIAPPSSLRLNLTVICRFPKTIHDREPQVVFGYSFDEQNLDS